MTKRARVAAALTGGRVDRVPLSFWGHDYAREGTAEGLAEAMLERQRRFDWDYMKVNPRATYYVEDFGCTFQVDEAGRARSARLAVRSIEDCRRLEPADPRRGAYAEQLEALKLIGEGLGGEVPFIQTVFSPISVLGRMTEGGEERVKEFIEADGDGVKAALSAITTTLSGYARACLEVGADGIFFATTSWATRDTVDEETYAEFARPYDLEILQAVQGASFNVLHICRDNNMFALLADYPVHAIHWAATLPGNPSLGEGQRLTSKAVMGGVGEATLANGTPRQVVQEVEAALAETGGSRVLIGPGCSISPRTPQSNLEAAGSAVRSAN